MENKTKKRLLSGIQPSGELTIGNYCGGIRQFIDFQAEYDSFIFLPDMHTITVPQGDPALIRERIKRMNGAFDLKSSPENGCIAVITISTNRSNER